MTDQVNIDTRLRGGLGLSSEYLARTSENNRTLADTRTDIEQTRAAAQETALTEQYRAQSGAVSAWQQRVNAAANTQAGIASQAANESTSMLNEAARVKLAGSVSAISQVRAAGLQAAEYHRMAQIISQVTHDMTRRIEEMGQYRF
jgi:hypothetical protein